MARRGGPGLATGFIDQAGENVRDLIREEWKVLAQAKPPDIEPGSHCTNPLICEFYHVCNKPLPADHVANLPGMSVKKLEELASRGIDSSGRSRKTSLSE